MREDAQRAAQPEGSPAPLHEGGEFEAEFVSLADAPGYRDVTLRLHVGPRRPTEITVHLSAEQGTDLMAHIGHVHAICWRAGNRPIDAQEGEQRPSWLDQTPTQRAGCAS